MNLIVSNNPSCVVSEIVDLILKDYTGKRFPVSLVLGIKHNAIPRYEKPCRIQLTIRRMDELKASIGKIWFVKCDLQKLEAMSPSNRMCQFLILCTRMQPEVAKKPTKGLFFPLVNSAGQASMCEKQIENFSTVHEKSVQLASYFRTQCLRLKWSRAVELSPYCPLDPALAMQSTASLDCWADPTRSG